MVEQGNSQQVPDIRDLLIGKGVQGDTELICGCMFSEKTDELIRRLNRFNIAVAPLVRIEKITEEASKEVIRAFKPEIDTRYSIEELGSLRGSRFPGIIVHHKHPERIFNYITSNTIIVAVDEVQFFPPVTLDIFSELNRRRITVLAAGLDLNFRGEVFSRTMGRLMAQSDKLLKLSAVCTKCGCNNATRTQRLVIEKDNEGNEISRRPANYSDPLVLVGSTNLYEARCKNCHEVPGKPVSGVIFQSK